MVIEWMGFYLIAKVKALPAGVYYYIIRLSENNRKITGFVTIIR